MHLAVDTIEGENFFVPPEELEEKKDFTQCTTDSAAKK